MIGTPSNTLGDLRHSARDRVQRTFASPARKRVHPDREPQPAEDGCGGDRPVRDGPEITDRRDERCETQERSERDHRVDEKRRDADDERRPIPLGRDVLDIPRRIIEPEVRDLEDGDPDEIAGLFVGELVDDDARERKESEQEPNEGDDTDEYRRQHRNGDRDYDGVDDVLGVHDR